MLSAKKTLLFIHIPPWLLSALFDDDSFGQKHQLRPGNEVISLGRWRSKGSFLQSLVVEDQSAVLPMQQLQMSSSPVKEDEHLATERVSLQLIAHNTTEGIKALAHIRRLTVEQISVGGRQREHQPMRISWAIRERSAAARCMFTPFR